MHAVVTAYNEPGPTLRHTLESIQDQSQASPITIERKQDFFQLVYMPTCETIRRSATSTKSHCSSVPWSNVYES